MWKNILHNTSSGLVVVDKDMLPFTDNKKCKLITTAILENWAWILV